ncbi:MAG: hypothetical protein KatS3mg102_0182 [Planctomycetota bacterium]|nr:MAG: hypothetical protein KatS3mg102_0182 [Planctomycetota bacterium]
MRRAVVEAAEACGFGPEAIAEIEVAVDEACANAVCHGSPEDGDISVEIALDERGLCATVADSNRRLAVHCAERSATGERSLEPMARWLRSERAGGLGLRLMERFMDEVEFAAGPARGNEVRLRKYRVLQQR